MNWAGGRAQKLGRQPRRHRSVELRTGRNRDTAGVYLVASGLLAGSSSTWVVAIPLVTYVAWGFGLRANLRANRMLLATTGTSTNVLSKAAYDLTRRRTSNPRLPRLAAAIGYIATQVGAEALYYAGAFGAAAFSDSITANEALVFLAGANLAAALYEYGLARLTRAFLRHRRHRYASFETGGAAHRGSRADHRCRRLDGPAPGRLGAHQQRQDTGHQSSPGSSQAIDEPAGPHPRRSLRCGIRPSPVPGARLGADGGAATIARANGGETDRTRRSRWSSQPPGAA